METLGTGDRTARPTSRLVGPNPNARANHFGLSNDLLVFADAEANGGKKQALSSLISIGFIGYNNEKQKVFAQEFCATPLAGVYDQDQIDRYWSQHAEEWKAIQEKQEDRRQVCAEIRQLFSDLKALGWNCKLYLRPAAFDFRLLTELYQTLGIEILANDSAFLGGEMSPKEILDQACCAYNLRNPPPAHYNQRNDMESPFGFGGITQVICMGNQLNGAARMLGLESLDFRVLLANLERELSHNGLQDAVDQAEVWFHALDLINDFAIAEDLGMRSQARIRLLEFFLPRGKFYQLQEQAIAEERKKSAVSFWDRMSLGPCGFAGWTIQSTFYTGPRKGTSVGRAYGKIELSSGDFYAHYTRERHQEMFGQYEGVEMVELYDPKGVVRPLLLIQ